MVGKNFVSGLKTDGIVTKAHQPFRLYQSRMPYIVGKDFRARISISAHKSPGIIMKTHKPFGYHIPYVLAKNFCSQNCYESYKSFWLHTALYGQQGFRSLHVYLVAISPLESLQPPTGLFGFTTLTSLTCQPRISGLAYLLSPHNRWNH